MPQDIGKIVTVTGSPFTYVGANTALIEHLVVAGGTVTSIKRVEEGVQFTLPFVTGIIDVRPGQQVVVTYSVAPTIVKLIGPVHLA
jgi:hypothetical protein